MEHQYGSSRWEVHARVRSPPDDDDDDDDDDFHDDGPLLTYNNEKYRRYPTYTERDGDRHNSEERERGKRSTLGVLLKFSLFCTAMILFCVLMYIPMYNRVIEHLPKDVVAGWTVHTNRDTKIYVQPNNVTLLHEPQQLCPKLGSKKKLYLLIIVCSSTVNFERRKAIRETWGSYKNYLELTKLYATIREKYRSYNYTYDLYPQPTSSINSSLEVNRTKRDIGLNQILPRLAEVLKKNMESKTEVATEEKRFDDDVDDKVITEFDMNKQFDDSNNDLQNYDYDYESNVMRIPPKGEEENKSLGDVLKALKEAHDITAQEQEEKDTVKEFSQDFDLDYKVAFLLGVPLENNTTTVQDLIEEEVNKYGDVIQENFIDSYNNLTLKSIMMLKYVTSNCKDTVRYILKTDDDMFINLPNLMRTLHNKSREFDARVATGYKEKEYLLVGDLIAGAKPVLDASNKWFSPRYLYPGRVYPRYLSGTGYVLAAAAAPPLYRAALSTPYLHLEDVYITGICAMRAVPRLRPAGAPGFNGRTVRAAATERACSAHAQVTSHRLSAGQLRALSAAMRDTGLLDKCERIRLTQVRRERLKPKRPPNRLTKVGKSLT